VNDVEAAGAEPEVERGDVDDDLVALAHLSQQDRVGPGRPPLSVDLDRQRVGGDDEAAAQLEPTAHASPVPPSPAAIAATIPSQTSSMVSRLRAGTNSSAVWTASVPLASRTQSKPSRRRALASLPPPIATRAGSRPAAHRPVSASASAGEDDGNL
jgi:hypothetical protein